MENLILKQAYLFFIYFLSGILIGIFFDIFRILRRSFKTSNFITYIEDILFWIITGLFLLFVLFKFSNGQIRIYNITGLLIGTILYVLSISKFFIKINVKILVFMKNVIAKIITIIFYPLRKIFNPFTFFVINLKKSLWNSNKIKKNEKN